MSLFKLKMKVLLFLVGSTVSFSAQNENIKANIKSSNINNRENYLISTTKKNNKNSSKNDKNSDEKTEENTTSTTEALKYSQRNDGIIDLDSLVHNEDTEYRVLNGTNVKIMLKCCGSPALSI